MTIDREQDTAHTTHVESGDSVTLTLDAKVIEGYDDGSLLVDADGSEIMVYEGEYQ